MSRQSYRDDRTYELPDAWPVVPDQVRIAAREQALRALDLPGDMPDVEGGLLRRLRAYYDPRSNYAGSLLSSLEPNDADDVSASDLLAVTMLSIDLNPRQVRILLEDQERRTVVHRLLRRLPPTAALTDLEDGQLDAMWDLYEHLKTLIATADSDSNRWVFASKLCARKRPELFPVRDSKVCAYLARGAAWGSGSESVGNFSIDMQIFADLITDDEITARLDEVRDKLESQHQPVVHDSRLRLLDAALWSQAMHDGL